ncbi:MAG: hypothetical protein KJZ91_20470 [Myxococcales bacterium]|nr:hypothetical protein [Myxococcales bacterium]
MRARPLAVAAVTALATLATLACGDRRADGGGGLPPAERWQAPAGADTAAAPPAETADERLARCVAEVFVAEAGRDGNLPSDVLRAWPGVADADAITLLRALVAAAGRLAAADQQALLLAEAGLALVERGETQTARAALDRAGALARRDGRDRRETRADLAVAGAARAWGRLGDDAAVRRLAADPEAAPYLARGLVEGGHGERADQVLAGLDASGAIEPFAAGELPIVDLLRGRPERARARLAAAPADWREVFALRLATAAVEHGHADARALVAQAAGLVDGAGAPPSMELELARLAHLVGDGDGARARRGRIHRALLALPDPDLARVALTRLHAVALDADDRAGAAAAIAALEERGARPWMLAMVRADALARAGELDRALDEVEHLAPSLRPPRGVVYVWLLTRHLARGAGERDAAFARRLAGRACG